MLWHMTHTIYKYVQYFRHTCAINQHRRVDVSICDTADEILELLLIVHVPQHLHQMHMSVVVCVRAQRSLHPKCVNERVCFKHANIQCLLTTGVCLANDLQCSPVETGCSRSRALALLLSLKVRRRVIEPFAGDDAVSVGVPLPPIRNGILSSRCYFVGNLKMHCYLAKRYCRPQSPQNSPRARECLALLSIPSNEY